MQFKTEIKAAVPRCKCKTCGVKTIAVPWAGKHSRFTMMFEAFAIKVLQSAANVKRAAELLGLSWDAVHSIMERAVDRGLDRRTKRVILEIYDASQEAIRTGQPCQTRLDPPPVDPRVAHPPRRHA